LLSGWLGGTVRKNFKGPLLCAASGGDVGYLPMHSSRLQQVSTLKNFLNGGYHYAIT
jgi:hypothetical protein